MVQFLTYLVETSMSLRFRMTHEGGVPQGELPKGLLVTDCLILPSPG